MIRTQSFFEDIIPLKLNQAGRTKANEMFFKSVSDFHGRMESVDVQVSGDLAVAHYIVLTSWTDKNGTHSQTSRALPPDLLLSPQRRIRQDAPSHCSLE